MTVLSRSHGLLLATLLLVPWCAQAATPTWQRSAALQAVDGRSTRATVARLLAHSAIVPAATLIDALLAIQHDSELSWPQRERILQAFAHAMGEEPPTSEGALVLEWLSRYSPRVLVAHEESDVHGVPLFNVPASAAGSLQRWQLELARNRALAALRSGDDTALLQWAEGGISAVALIGLEQALSQAPSAAIRRQSRALQTLISKRPAAAPLALVLAERIGTLEPLRLALLADGPGAVQLVARIRRLPASTAQDLWVSVVDGGKPAVASAALVELARAGMAEPVVKRLGDPQLGPAAALALAQSSALDMLSDALVGTRPDSTAQRHAALGLKLEGSPAARAILATFVRQHHGATAQEVSRWLR